MLKGDEDMHCSFLSEPFVFEHGLKYLLFSVAKSNTSDTRKALFTGSYAHTPSNMMT